MKKIKPEFILNVIPLPTLKASGFYKNANHDQSGAVRPEIWQKIFS